MNTVARSFRLASAQPTSLACGEISRQDLAQTEEVPCDLCGQVQFKPVLSAIDMNWQIQAGTWDAASPPSEWHVVRCVSCGLVYLNPRPKSEFITDHYPKKYYAYRNEGSPKSVGVKQRIKQIIRRQRLLWSSFQLLGLGNPLRDAVTEEVGWVRPGKVFDVGCGAGISLDSFQALGWETSGIDISLEAVEVARSKGHTISLGDLCTAGLPEASFDVVLMSHVLEHMPSPRLALSAIRRMLRLGGYLIIEVPNLATFWTLIFRQRSWNWDLPRHFYHFTAETLRRLLDTAGFEIIKLRTKGTANYLLQSIAVSLLEKGVTNSLGDVGSPSEILQDEKLRNALAPLAEMMAQRGQGNLLRVVARRPN